MDFFDTLFSFIKPKEINEYEVSNPTSKICTEDEEEKSFKEQEEEKPTVKEDGNLANVEEKSGNPPSIRDRSKSGEFKCNECEGSLQIFSTMHEKMQISLKWLKYRLKIIISSFKYYFHTVTMVSKLKKYKKNTLG